MDENRTLRSLERSFSSALGTTTIDQESLLNKIESAVTLMNVIQARTTLITGHIKEAKESRRDSTLPNIDMTCANQNYKDKLNELWDAVEDMQLKSASLKTLVFSIKARHLIYIQKHQMDSQLSLNSRVPEEFTEKIFALSTDVVTESEKRKILCGNQEEALHKFVERQILGVNLIADVGQKIALTDCSPGFIKEQERKKKRVSRTEIARSLINCLLSINKIDFEQHSDLLEIKIKWRPPIKK